MGNPFQTLCFVRNDDTPSPLQLLCTPMGYQMKLYRRFCDVESVLLNDPKVLILVSVSNENLTSRGIPVWLERKLPMRNLILIDVSEKVTDPVYALKLGIRGLIFNNARVDNMLVAVRAILMGELWYSRSTLEQTIEQLLFQQHRVETDASTERLTSREQSVARLVAEGARNKEIAARLFISEYTVKAHLASIFRKTETRNRVEMIGKLGMTA
ncbi:response regulator transcription factor [Ferrimonas pelagia]|uniref:LuxR C-terminal-related transcriptional regulator n=1 Tax=Ferrimonas pelagia TaxID=1177826 RepID=A0ABP9EFW8_9GAMM